MKTRKAIGCIIVCKNKFIIINKISNSDIKTQKNFSEWDFVKGGIKEGEKNIDAVLRELKEETGSDRYKILYQLPNKLIFDFKKSGIENKNLYDNQETIFYLVEFLGMFQELHGDGKEIGEIKCCTAKEVLDLLSHEETKLYFSTFLNEYKRYS